MTEIQEAIIVDCPYARATSYLDDYLEKLERDGDGAPILHLRAQLVDLGIPGALTLARTAVAKFALVPDPQNLDHSIAVSWAPSGGGPFPRFVGFLVLSADPHDGVSCLTLEGDYAPPLGAFGTVFDAAIGRRIARGTARQLLAALQAHLEKKHREGYAPPTAAQ